jgi:hypothetical protein
MLWRWPSSLQDCRDGLPQDVDDTIDLFGSGH